MTLPGAGKGLAFPRVHGKVSESAPQVFHTPAIAGVRLPLECGDKFGVVLSRMANGRWLAGAYNRWRGTSPRWVFMDRHASVAVAFRRKAISGIYSCNGSWRSVCPESSHAVGWQGTTMARQGSRNRRLRGKRSGFPNGNQRKPITKRAVPGD